MDLGSDLLGPTTWWDLDFIIQNYSEGWRRWAWTQLIVLPVLPVSRHILLYALWLLRLIKTHFFQSLSKSSSIRIQRCSSNSILFLDLILKRLVYFNSISFPVSSCEIRPIPSISPFLDTGIRVSNLRNLGDGEKGRIIDYSRVSARSNSRPVSRVSGGIHRGRIDGSRARRWWRDWIRIWRRCKAIITESAHVFGPLYVCDDEASRCCCCYCCLRFYFARFFLQGVSFVLFFSAIFLIVVWFSSSPMSGIDECLDVIAQDRIFFSASSAHMCILRVSNEGLGMTTDSWILAHFLMFGDLFTFSCWWDLLEFSVFSVWFLWDKV